MQKARRHPIAGHRPLVGAQFQVLFHPPVRGPFHLSLTVLVHYRSSRSPQPCRMVPADSAGVPPAPAYSGSRGARRRWRYVPITHCGGASQRLPATDSPAPVAALQPRAGLDPRGLGLPAFARHYSRGHSCFPLLRVLGCFGSPGSRALRRARPPAGRVVPFGHPRIKARSPLPGAFRRLPRPSKPLEA